MLNQKKSISSYVLLAAFSSAILALPSMSNAQKKPASLDIIDASSYMLDIGGLIEDVRQVEEINAINSGRFHVMTIGAKDFEKKNLGSKPEEETKEDHLPGVKY